MTDLITKDDSRYFSQTSDKPYDRHHYKIVSKTKTIVVESWDEVQEYWWNNCNSPWFEGAVFMLLTNQNKNPKDLNNERI